MSAPTTLLNSVQTDGVTVQAFFKKVLDLGDGNGPQQVGGLVEVDWPVADASIAVAITTEGDGTVRGPALMQAVLALAAAQKAAQGK